MCLEMLPLSVFFTSYVNKAWTVKAKTKAKTSAGKTKTQAKTSADSWQGQDPGPGLKSQGQDKAKASKRWP